MTLSKLHASINLQQIGIIKLSETVVYKIIRNHYIQQTIFVPYDFLTVICR